MQKLKTEAIIAKRQLPYIYKYYNVSCFTPNPRTLLKNTMARFINALIKALNDSLKMPRIILFVPEDDLLQFIKTDEHNAREVIFKCLNWMAIQVDRAIEAKVDALRIRKPGSILTNEPKIIWVKMIKRLNKTSEVLTLRTKYNEALHDIVGNRTGHYIMDITRALAERNCCDQFNQLNGLGKSRYWNQIDQQLELFDKQKITLEAHEQRQQVQVYGYICIASFSLSQFFGEHLLNNSNC